MSRPTARPLIGVTTYRQDTRWWSWDRDAALVPGVYLDTVVAAGGWPVLFPPLADGVAEEGDAVAVTRVVGTLVDAVDGLVVIGGGDVSSERYGQEPDQRNGGMSQFRDELELQLLDAALERDLPLLAICREIARALKGRIDVESQIGVGSTFTLWVPLVRGAADRTLERLTPFPGKKEFA